MINVACIVTKKYVERALTMFNSMLGFRDDMHLHILIVNSKKESTHLNFKNVSIYHLYDYYDHPKHGLAYRCTVAQHGLYKPSPELISRYDYLRWALKPVFVNILLEDYDKVFYCDNDLHFYNDFSFLDELSDHKTMCVSPHWRTIRHNIDGEWEYNYKHGLYNGGFFIVTKAGQPILNWWSEMCIHRCTADNDPTYVDQKYLDVVPLYFDNVEIIRHKGCNVAAWNLTYSRRQLKNGKVMCGGDDIVFIHYSPVTIKNIENGKDHLLLNHYNEYKSAIIHTRTEMVRNQMSEFINDTVIGSAYLI